MADKETLAHQPQRSFRAEDELWEAALSKAREDDMTLSQVIRRFLVDYTKPAKAKRVSKPKADAEVEVDEDKHEEETVAAS